MPIKQNVFKILNFERGFKVNYISQTKITSTEKMATFISGYLPT